MTSPEPDALPPRASTNVVIVRPQRTLSYRWLSMRYIGSALIVLTIATAFWSSRKSQIPLAYIAPRYTACLFDGRLIVWVYPTPRTPSVLGWRLDGDFHPNVRRNRGLGFPAIKRNRSRLVLPSWLITWTWYVSIPLWVFVAFIGALMALLLRSRPRDAFARCSSCSYRLTGLIEPRCPECGTPFEMRSNSEAIDGKQ